MITIIWWLSISILQKFTVKNMVMVMIQPEMFSLGTVSPLHSRRICLSRPWGGLFSLLRSWISHQLDFQWSKFDSSCCMYLFRSTTDYNWSVMEVSSTSTMFVQTWCTTIGLSTTTMTRLRCLIVGVYIRQDRVFPTLGEMMKASCRLSESTLEMACCILLVLVYCYVFCFILFWF